MQDTIKYMEKKRSGLLETVERKQKVRIGAPEEFQASIFQDVMTLDHKMSEGKIELHEAKEELRTVAMERRRTEAKGLRVMGVAGADVGSEAAPGAHSSKAEALVCQDRLCSSRHRQRSQVDVP